MTTTTTCAIAEDARLFILGDEGVVFSEGTQRLFGLNTAAVVIWCLLEEGKEPTEIIDHLAETSGESNRVVAHQVRAVLDDWRSCGLLKSEIGAKQYNLERQAEEDPDRPLPSLKDEAPKYACTHL